MTARATGIGWRRGRMKTPVPSLIVSVRVATPASTTNGSNDGVSACIGGKPSGV